MRGYSAIKNSYGLKKPEAPAPIYSSNQDDLMNSKFKSSQGILKNYKLGRVIGQGAYAVVRLAEHRETNQKFAVKIYDKSKLNDQMKRRAVQREILVLNKINHPNIIKSYDQVETAKQIFIVTDYIGGISLNQFVKSKCINRVVKEQTCRKLFK